MKISPECILCFMKQTLSVTQRMNLDDDKAKEILDEIALMVPSFSFNEVPPEIAARIYEKIVQMTKVSDIYAEVKQSSIKKAEALMPRVREYVEASEDKLYMAAKAAVLGNVIDYGIDYQFDLDEEMRKIFQMPFAIDDFELFRHSLPEAKKVLYIGDNAGENIFDEFFIEVLKEHFPQLEFTYVTRGKPIINDITIDDIKACKIFEMAEVLSSGVGSPGLVYERANDEVNQAMAESDLIISKGMGNFEALSEKKNLKMFFFFKVKCDVVADHLNRAFGSIICKLNT